MIATIEVQSTNFDKQCQITPVICTKKRSGQRDYIPRPSAWETGAPPAKLCPDRAPNNISTDRASYSTTFLKIHTNSIEANAPNST